MKTPGAEFSLPARNSMVGILLRVVSGETATIQKGETFRVRLPDVIQPQTIINLKGQALTIEGLPKGLEGKTVILKLATHGTFPTFELINTSRVGVTLHNNSASLPLTNQQSAMLSADKKAGMKGKLQADHTESIKQGSLIQTNQKNKTTSHQTLLQTAHIRTALLSSGTASLPLHQGKNSLKFEAIVIRTSGKTALLKNVPYADSVSTNAHTHAQTKPTKFTTQTAHAIAQSKHPETLISTEKTPLPQIKIENISAALKQGEHLQVEIKTINGPDKKTELLLKTIESPSVPPISRNTAIPKTPSMNIPENGWFTTRIEQRLSNGNIAFNWQGNAFESKAPEAVKAGDTLLIKATGTGKERTFEVIDIVKNIPNKAINLFRQKISQSEPLKQSLNTLLQSQIDPASSETRPMPASVNTQITELTRLLENYSITSEKPLDGSRLAAMMKNSGQFYEALLGKEMHSSDKPLEQIQARDLKASLLKLFEVTRSADHFARTTQIMQASEQGTARIESQQAINLLAFQQAEPIRIEFPLMIQGMLSAVQMAISMQPMSDPEAEQKTETPADGTFNILFALELSQLGHVRVDARITNNSVHATIYSEQHETRHLFQQHITRLTERLETLGFTDIQLSTRSSHELLAEKQENFNRLELGFPISKGLLDVTG